MNTTRRTYQVHLITNNGRRYDQSLRAYLKDYLKDGGVLPPVIAVPKGCGTEASRVLRDLPGGDAVEITEIGGCLTREVWFLVSEERSDI